MFTQSNEKKCLPDKFFFIIIAVVAIVISLIVEINHQKAAKQLAEYGEQRFIEEVLPTYISNFQIHGIDDLNIIPVFLYSYDDDYNKSEKSLDLRCEFEFTSSHIDTYFTTGNHEIPRYALAEVMKGIWSCYTEDVQNYELDNIGTVTVSIQNNREFIVKTPSVHEYKLKYDRHAETVHIEIDGEEVYSENHANTDEIFGETPYEGLSEEHINHTGLGFYDDIEYCLNYFSLRESHRYKIYIWHDANGKEIFSAQVGRGEVYYTYDSRNRP